MVFFNKAIAVATIGASCLLGASAMPAYPLPFEAQGTQIKAVGTPWNHRLIDASNGYTVVKNDAKQYVYAEVDNLGYLAPSNLVVGSVNPASQPNLLPGMTGRLDAVQQEAAKDLAAGTPGVYRRRLQGQSTVKNFVLRLKFNDHQSREYPPDTHYDRLFNQISTPENQCSRVTNGVPDTECVTPTGSVKDFYLENSYGGMNLDSTISPWQITAQGEKYYGAGCSSTCNEITRLHTAIKAALKDIDDGGFDWGPFDDGTGNIAMFSIVHSGYGAEYGQPDSYGTEHTDRVWSHKYYLSQNPNGSGYTTRTGLRINTYHINPGVWGLEGHEAPHIGVISHESGHFLGLPDLYDTDGSSSGLGSYGLMANSWGFDGDQDNFPHMSAWSKAFVGFLEPQTLTASQTIEVAEVHSNAAVYKVTHGFPSNEYLLIENRQAVSFDANMPQGGMLIWHIDENKAGSSNANNANEGYPGKSDWPGVHYHVALLQADGLYELEKARERGDAGDVWTTGQTLSDTTTPSLNAYSKKSCQTATSGLTGNKIVIGALNAQTKSLTMTYTKGNACSCGQTCVAETEAPTPPPTSVGATAAPTATVTAAPTSSGICQDDPEGWHDIDGATYNCEWYSVGTRCAQYGDDFANQGKTANQACCACGGGSTATTPTPTKAPTPEVCVDVPEGWYDADGPTYNCAWYASGTRCAQYGNSFPNNGVTANQACCACGGGSLGSRVPQSPGDQKVVTKKDPADLAPSNSGGATIAIALSGGIAMGAVAGGLATKKYIGKNEAGAPVQGDDFASAVASGNPIFENQFNKV